MIKYTGQRNRGNNGGGRDVGDYGSGRGDGGLNEDDNSRDLGML